MLVKVPNVWTSGSRFVSIVSFTVGDATKVHTNQVKQADNISIIFGVCRQLLLPRRQSAAS
jgi:hypothetical protein